ncbi:hypothetical protein [Marinobacter santoriniensis]|uniref:hypothetical protein n=1 Tax=Marinobacter santoriniensis TaxID=523742 RepID=UPI00126A2C41|nr:hypothetical protein [Marinobacter santoriniensis]
MGTQELSKVEVSSMWLDLSSLSASEITSICALFVAAISVLISLWQASVARKHNRLSVKPHIDPLFDTFAANPVSCILDNHGIGPAFFRSFKFYYRGGFFNIDNYEDIKMFFYSVGIDLNEVSHKVWIPDCNSALVQGKSVAFFEFSSSKNDPFLHKKLTDVVDNLGLVIEYSCIYGVRYKTERNLQA